MTDSPRIHLGSLLRADEDAHADGVLDHLEYEQGGQTQTLTFAGEAPYDVDVNSLGGHEMYLQGSFEPTLVMDCARCLRPVEVPLEITLGTLLRYEPTADAPYLEEAESGEEVLVFGDPNLDLSAYLAETTLLAAPLSVLHDPACRGLCQVCGHDLNDGPCEHMAQVPVEEIDDDLGIPEGTTHAKQNPFAALADLKLPEDK
ncbi:YceD family protein [uncultured Deinococcus sp.]|uniref:YceD family protein n=1 Tax=uncultured Deinococcus sp. TaxID=158789 RepID=UPI0025D12706|nr:YceD family protein [uncultured Deinococcus sp.]